MTRPPSSTSALYGIRAHLRTQCPACGHPMLLATPFTPRLACGSCGEVSTIPLLDWSNALAGCLTRTVGKPEGTKSSYTDFEEFGQFSVRFERVWPGCHGCASPVSGDLVERAIANGSAYVCGCGAASALRRDGAPTNGPFVALAAIFGEVVDAAPRKGGGTRVLSCATCGAELATAAGGRSVRCAYCRAENHLRGTADRSEGFTFLVREAELLAFEDEDDDDDDAVDAPAPVVTLFTLPEPAPPGAEVAWAWARDGVGARDEREWALVLQSPLSILNDSDARVLGGYASRAEAEAAGLPAMLSRDWSVTNAATLLPVLEWLRAEGHRRPYGAAMWRPDAPPWLRKMRDENARHLSKVSFLAWDAARLVALAGWGAVLGWIPPEQAHAYVFGAALAVQPAYTEWREYLWAYALGLQVLRGGEMDWGFVTNLLMLADDPDALWLRTPWTHPLTFPRGGPEPLPMATFGHEAARASS